MKKLLIACLAVVSIASATVPAQAGGDNPWPVIGGVVGGLLLGEALRDNRQYHHAPRRYYYDDYHYDRVCWTEYRRVWSNNLGRHITKAYRYCD